jgi:hypothetical protein
MRRREKGVPHDREKGLYVAPIDMEKGAGRGIVQCSTVSNFKKGPCHIFLLKFCFLDKFSPRSIILALFFISRRYSQL